MKANLLIILALLIVPLALAGGLHRTPPVSPPVSPSVLSQETNAPTVPAFTFTDRAGKERTIGDFAGRVVVLNFWASWCAPCVVEFPHLLQLARDNPERVVLLLLSSDHDAAAMERFLTRQPTTDIERDNVVIALDPDGAITRDLFQTYRLPETILIDGAGRMRHKLIGADWRVEDAQGMIEGL